jgi:hypothetical protein
MKKIVITLGRNGSVKAEAVGFVGPACQDATKFLDGIFKGKKEDLLKPEYYEENKSTSFEIDGLPGGGRFCG